MSVDDISHFSRSGLDELVPSRYVEQVGDVEVLVISDGVLPITAATLATNADPADLAGWLEGMFLPPDVLAWPLNVVVVRSADRTILVDAGLGVEFPDFPRSGLTVHRLIAAGIDPADVTDVVLTHLHMAHVGGLLSDGVKAQFNPDSADPPCRPARPSSGRRRISPAPPCRRRCPTYFAASPHSSSTSTAAGHDRSRRSTRSRRGC